MWGSTHTSLRSYPQMALSDTAIRNAKPASKAFKLYDESGLFVLINPNGGKWWRLKYRFDNKEKLLSLGTYPEVSLKDAREKRDAARRLIAGGVDPSAARQAEKSSRLGSAANSFEAVAREWWASHMANKAPSHKNKVLRRFELYLFPWIGKKPIADITAPEVLTAITLCCEIALQSV